MMGCSALLSMGRSTYMSFTNGINWRRQKTWFCESARPVLKHGPRSSTNMRAEDHYGPRRNEGNPFMCDSTDSNRFCGRNTGQASSETCV